jgi:hypothetical protein
MGAETLIRDGFAPSNRFDTVFPGGIDFSKYFGGGGAAGGIYIWDAGFMGGFI